MIETRIDSVKILQLSKRAIPLGAPDIGNWYKVFNTIGTISVITNTLLSVFAFSDIDQYAKSSTEAKIWIFVAAEVNCACNISCKLIVFLSSILFYCSEYCFNMLFLMCRMTFLNTLSARN
jgi:hypothetical protein